MVASLTLARRESIHLFMNHNLLPAGTIIGKSYKHVHWYYVYGATCMVLRVWCTCMVLQQNRLIVLTTYILLVVHMSSTHMTTLYCASVEIGRETKRDLHLTP